MLSRACSPCEIKLTNRYTGTSVAVHKNFQKNFRISRNSRIPWPFLFVVFLIHIPAGSAANIYITHSLAEGVCNAWQNFEAGGNLTDPPKMEPGSPHLTCGYFRLDKCDLPCTPIPEYVSCNSPVGRVTRRKYTESSTKYDLDGTLKRLQNQQTPVTYENGEENVTEFTLHTVKQSLYRIVGGQTVAYREKYPSIVQVHILGKPKCGGTIIGSEWVLTAAHCLKLSTSPSDYFIRAGAFDRLNPEKYEQDRKVRKIFKHESYDIDKNYNDIALFKVDKFDFSSSKVRSVKIPAKSYVTTQPKLWAVGWGKIAEEGIQVAAKLQEVDLPSIDTRDCMNILDKELNIQNSILPDKVICAGYKDGGKDACQGDSGGPLYEEPVGMRVVVGVVSWGKGCARRGLPGVYTKVAAYNDWILSKISQG